MNTNHFEMLPDLQKMNAELEKRGVDKRVILAAVVGSRLHGLDTPTSDYDIRFVTMADLSAVISPWGEAGGGIQLDGEDVEQWELREFAKHASKGNPTILEVLWSDLYVATPEGEALKAIRRSFLDSKAIADSHMGYTDAQLKRYLRPDLKTDQYKGMRHERLRRWLHRMIAQLRWKLTRDANKAPWIADEITSRRHRKATVAAVRVLLQAVDLLRDGHFQCRVDATSKELSDKLMSWKTVKFDQYDVADAVRLIDEMKQDIRKVEKSLGKSKQMGTMDRRTVDEFLLSAYLGRFRA